jgi:uncharacterized iron-regulated membrane protein
VVAYLPSDAADLPQRVLLSRGIVSVNQYTGEILGVRTRGQTLLGIIRAVHVRLAAGDAGRFVLKWAAVALLFSLISGIYLWWPAKRLRIHGSRGSTKSWFDFARRCRYLLVSALAGAGGKWNHPRFRRSACACSRKAVGFPPPRAPSEPRPNATEITPDEAVAIARRELPDALPYRVQMPRYGGLYVVALEDRDQRIGGDRNSVSIDSREGKLFPRSWLPDSRFNSAL